MAERGESGVCRRERSGTLHALRGRVTPYSEAIGQSSSLYPCSRALPTSPGLLFPSFASLQDACLAQIGGLTQSRQPMAKVG